FYEKGVSLLKENGCLDFITSGKFFEASYGKPLIEFLFTETEVCDIINFNDLPVFIDVTAYPIIFYSRKTKKDGFNFNYYNLTELPQSTLISLLQTIKPLKISKYSFIQNDFKFINTTVSEIINKTKLNAIPLEKFCGLPIVGVKTGYNDGYITTLDISEFVKPYVFGRDIKKYQPVNPANKIIFPYDTAFNIITLNNEKELMTELNRNKEKLSQRAIIKEGLVNGTKSWFEYQ